MPIRTSEELINAFGIRGLNEYENIIPFTDSIGFSVQRRYPEDCAFKPAVDSNGNPNHVCLIRLGLDQQTPGRTLVPLSADVGVFNRWLATHLDYDFNDRDSPTAESVAKSKRSPRPADLVFWDEFFYHVEADVFQDSEGNTVAAPAILGQIFQAHLDTLSRGYRARAKIKRSLKSFIVSLLSALYNGTMKLLWVMHGIRLNTRSPGRSLFEHRWEDFERVSEKEENINIFGYPMPKRSLFVYLILIVLVAILATWLGFLESRIGKVIHGNVVLSTIVALLLLCLFDQVLPVLFRYAVMVLARLRTWVLFSDL